MNNDFRSIAIKLGVLELQTLVEMAVIDENYTEALRLCAEFAPEMNRYMDMQEGREQIVIHRWLDVCKFASGADLSKVSA